MRVAFYTLGCKVNQYETGVLEQQFMNDGFDIVSPDEEADIYIVNSCTVTSTGDKKSRQALRRFKRKNPAAKAVLTGCFPQAFPDAAEKIPEADVITGAANRLAVLDAVKRCLASGERIIEITPHVKDEKFESMQATSFLDRTRAFIKIEDGCDRFCSYCIIPISRGRVRSKPLEELRQELTALASSGYREVVLTGINLSSYGKDTGNRMIDAVKLACAAPGIERVRLGSLEPELLSDEDISEMSKLGEFCDQFHLSLQSGCDRTLREMNRHYTAEEYDALVRKLRRVFPNCAVTTDIMVGFPGETEEDFLENLAFAKKVGFAKVHVFAYSIREGTRAAKMEAQVPKQVKEQRSRRMIELTDKTRREFLSRQVGRIEEVLLEQLVSPGVYEGYTKNYTPVRIRSDLPLKGQIKFIKLTGITDDFCTGELLQF
ncbi:tRNA (N(6)-L-threonylcarbamoyladenosine(37)-C(2))-methylthiotransferase MtaB [Candidatus Soleaferrea massiliensis]|uniref:tRNA (N(6)-L-threonylcarbamoyladenosine(37)-C(2))- methylthiotransferase MtaB n=1 Tax=Candidatus Soleaferrea massiliensis TaxID=1470354 RepID=UPI00058C52D7|nr:tRNA (N(6)-L-threonylcarbamoyladenosine(37)-C(2))-methylthiotransferase MtaB [Candidatus Soleaferrea massiliensis]